MDTSSPELTFASRLKDAFEARRDPGRADAMSAYMRGQFRYYGIPAPVQKAVWREASSGLERFDEPALRRFALDAWGRDEREWQYAACALLRRDIRSCSPRFVATLQKLIVTKSWWDTVDTLASHSVGPLVTAHPSLVATMDAWVEHDDFWLARTAILYQLGYKARTDADRLFAYCVRRAGDKEFFIRKAIGWALREYSKTDPDAVRSFVEEHRSALSGLSVREALKRIGGA